MIPEITKGSNPEWNYIDKEAGIAEGRSVNPRP